MTIVYDDTGENPQPSKPQNPNIIPPDYKSAFVDSRYINRKDIIAQISGRPWITTYWSRYLTSENETSSLNINRQAVYQQYMKIINLELKVIDPYNYQVDSGSKESTITGRAVMYPGLTPNKGDMFTADIGNGHLGLFSVSDAQPKSFLLETVYEIEYKLVDYAKPEYLADLEEKTQQVAYFVKQLVQNGQRGILFQEEYDLYGSAVGYFMDFSKNFFTSFFNREFNTFLVPDQPESVYDQYMAKAIMSVFNLGEDNSYNHVILYNCVDGYETVTTTIWDALIAMDESVLYSCETQLGTTTIDLFHPYTMYQNIRHCGIKRVYYPKGRKNTSHSQLQYAPMPSYAPLKPSRAVKRSRPISLGHLVVNDLLDGFDDVSELERLPPPIHPITIDEYYVFSEAFYQLQPKKMSELELLVTEAFKDRPLSGKRLLTLCEASRYWGELERFYYIPILALLIHQFIKRL